MGSSRFKGFHKLNFEEDLWIEYVNLYKVYSIFVPKKKDIPIWLTHWLLTQVENSSKSGVFRLKNAWSWWNFREPVNSCKVAFVIEMVGMFFSVHKNDSTNSRAILCWAVYLKFHRFKENTLPSLHIYMVVIKTILIYALYRLHPLVPTCEPSKATFTFRFPGSNLGILLVLQRFLFVLQMIFILQQPWGDRVL